MILFSLFSAERRKLIRNMILALSMTVSARPLPADTSSLATASNVSTSHQHSMTPAIVGGILGGIALILGMIISAIIIRRQRKRSQQRALKFSTSSLD